MDNSHTDQLVLNHCLNRLEDATKRDSLTIGQYHLDEWLGDVVSTITALPASARQYFTGHYMLNSAACGSSGQFRANTLKQAINDLKQDIAAVKADKSFGLDGKAPTADLSDRPKTKAEAANELFAELDLLDNRSFEFTQTIGKLTALHIQEMTNHLNRALKLSSKETIKDVAKYNIELIGYITRAQRVAEQNYHLIAKD